MEEQQEEQQQEGEYEEHKGYRLRHNSSNESGYANVAEARRLAEEEGLQLVILDAVPVGGKRARGL